MTPRRLLIVSNRLPVNAQHTSAGVRMVPSGGGLASGLRPWHEQAGGIWIGWPGDMSTATTAEREGFDQRLHDDGIVPVHLSAHQVDRFYHGFANRVLWPLFHYLIDRLPVDGSGWDAYREVNEAFADVVAREYRPDDTIWVHDYQLMLLPALLRERLPDARIGFFLHIPFPSSDVFRILPWRRQILNGLLGADLVGFHTFSYMRHFMTSLLHIEGVEADVDRVRTGDREVKLGVFPMGVDAAAFVEVLEGKKVIEVRLRGVSKSAAAQQVEAESGPGTLIVAIGDDRTDEELFRALPLSSLTVAVGRPWTSAAFRLDDHRAVRRLLLSLVAEAGSADARAVLGESGNRVSA